MLADPKQIMRYSEAEKAVMKRVFKDNPALYALRNHFWDLELSEDEKKLLDFDADTLKLVKKVFIPEVAGDIPLNQQVDFTSDPLVENLHQMNPALACIMLDAQSLMEEYLNQRFLKLVTKDLEYAIGEIILKDLKKRLGNDQDEIRHVNMLAYQAVKRYIDTRVYEIKYLSDPPEELTPEQKKIKEAKNDTR